MTLVDLTWYELIAFDMCYSAKIVSLSKGTKHWFDQYDDDINCMT